MIPGLLVYRSTVQGKPRASGDDPAHIAVVASSVA
mgnify:CR=1 FL=1